MVEYAVLVAITGVALIAGIVLLQQGVASVYAAQNATLGIQETSTPTAPPSSSVPAPPSSSVPAPPSSSVPAPPSSSAPAPTPTTLPNVSIAQGGTLKLNSLPGLPSGATVTFVTLAGQQGQLGVITGQSGDYTYQAPTGNNKSVVITFSYLLGGTTVSANKVTIST